MKGTRPWPDPFLWPLKAAFRGGSTPSPQHRHWHDRLTGAGKSTLVAQIAAESVQRGEKLAVAYDPRLHHRAHLVIGRVDFGRVDESVFYRSLAIAGED